MLYSFFVLLFGIYLGQEFTLPSVKLLALTFVGQQNVQNQPPLENNNVNYIEQIIEYFLNARKE